VMEIASGSGPRDVAAADFFEGTWATAVGPTELLTAVRFPVWEGRCGFAVEEVARRHGDFALVGVVCGIKLGGDGVEQAALAFFGVGATPIRARAAEDALVAGSTPAEVARIAMETIDPTDDLHATGGYRRTVAGVLVQRAIQRAMQEARNA
jgi:aerobic carbon-monoxide dehydrogenase medium subunit